MAVEHDPETVSTIARWAQSLLMPFVALLTAITSAVGAYVRGINVRVKATEDRNTELGLKIALLERSDAQCALERSHIAEEVRAMRNELSKANRRLYLLMGRMGVEDDE